MICRRELSKIISIEQVTLLLYTHSSKTFDLLTKSWAWSQTNIIISFINLILCNYIDKSWYPLFICKENLSLIIFHSFDFFFYLLKIDFVSYYAVKTYQNDNFVIKYIGEMYICIKRHSLFQIINTFCSQSRILHSTNFCVFKTY